MSRKDFKHGLVAAGVTTRAMAFDRERFVQNTMGDAGLQREVIGLFVGQIAQTRQQLQTHKITVKDRKFLGHSLRGAAAAVGAVEIEELARSWEKVSFDPAVLDALLSQAESAFLDSAKHYYP